MQVAIDVSMYRADGTVDQSSKIWVNGKLVILDAPTLNITTYFVDTTYFSYFSVNNTYPRWIPSTQWIEQDFLYKNVSYSWEAISEGGQCRQTDPPSYAWGFSFLLLFITVLFTAIWSIGIYIMWLDAHLNSRYDRAGREMGTYRAALDLARAMRKDMGEEATENLSNTELKERVKRHLNGGRISFELLDSADIDRHRLPMTRITSVMLWWEFNGWDTWSKRKRIAVLSCVVALFIAVMLAILVPVLSKRHRCISTGRCMAFN